MTAKIWEMLTRTNGLSYRAMFAALLMSCAAGLFIFFVYRLAAKATFYVRSFGVTLAGVCVLTTALIIAMQSSLVVSLGMVGALSIVRFRTAVKDPLDLMFIFWAVSSGIIAGTRLYLLLAVVAVVMTAVCFGLEKAPLRKETLVLVFHSDKAETESAVLGAVKKQAGSYRVRSRNWSGAGLDEVVEFRAKDPAALMAEVSKLEGVSSCSVLSYDGDVRRT